MAAKSRTSLLRVLHFAYLLEPMPIARSAEMIQTVISVPVTEKNKEAKRVNDNPTPALQPVGIRIVHSGRVLRIRTTCDSDCVV
jgi:hypothetical protein